MSADPAEKPAANKQQRSNRGQFQKGHLGYKKKGTTNKFSRSIKDAALQAAAEIGGKGGLKEYLKKNDKLRDDILRESLPARAKGVLVDAAGNPLELGDADASRSGPTVDTVNIIAVPHGYSVIGLYGLFEAHVQTEALPRLRGDLPPGSITRPPSADNFEPAWPASPPALRVIGGGDEPEAA